ncbi:MAG TPA: ABC transporter ATP-binding protein [Thermoprotei archaeon]|nr:ABC transporter ATP-binding protein [Thermoprotei archaeon]
MIEFRNVWFKYDETEEYILKNINLVIEKGRIYSILGDNGSGKTTLIRHMNGLLKPTKGDVIVDEVNTRDIPISILSKKVALVFQYPERMFFSPTVEEEIKYTLINFGFEGKELDERTDYILKEFRLEDFRDRAPFSLSGGEQRRLSIAIAVSWDPDYIVLDEPTTGLDGEARKDLTSTIEKILNRRRTVIIVSHDLEYLFELSPHVILMNNGQIMFQGKFGELLENEDIVIKCGLSMPRISLLLHFLKRDGNLNNLKYNEILNLLLDKLRCTNYV